MSIAMQEGNFLALTSTVKDILLSSIFRNIILLENLLENHSVQ